MRGKRITQPLLARAIRITPADAGKTCMVDSVRNVFQDHPRGCEENLKSRVCPKIRTGSPPRMRGKQQKYLPLFKLLRITPADAGKTEF